MTSLTLSPVKLENPGSPAATTGHVRTTRQIVAAAALAVLASLVTGCVVDQPADVATYHTILDTDRTPSADVSPLAANDPLTLTHALELAVANDEMLQLQGETYLQSLITRDRVFGNFLPSLSLGPEFALTDKTHIGGDDPNSPIGAFVKDQTLDVPLDMSIGGNPWRDAEAVRGVEPLIAAERSRLLDLREKVMMDVVTGYYTVLRAEARVDVLAHAEEVQNEHLSEEQTRFKAGTAREFDVAQADAQVAATRNRRLAAGHDVIRSRRMLAWLIGVNAINGPLQDDVDVPMSPSADALLADAERQREDLRAAAYDVEVESRRVKMAWKEFYPTISLDVSYFLSRQSFPADVAWTSMLHVSVPIFSRGLIRADVRTAYSQWRRAKMVDARLRRQVARDVDLALEDLRHDREQLDQLDVQRAAANRSVQVADTAYRAGTATTLERLVAQDHLIEADQQLADRRFQEKVDYLDLVRVAGGLNAWSAKDMPSP